MPDLDAFKKIPLEPGTHYRFRLSALNACGRGEYGEVCFHRYLFPLMTDEFHQTTAKYMYNIVSNSCFQMHTGCIVQNMLTRLSGRTVSHQNIEITRRGTFIVGATAGCTRRNIRILCIFSYQIAAEQRENAANAIGICSCLCWSKLSMYSSKLIVSYVTR